MTTAQNTEAELAPALGSVGGTEGSLGWGKWGLIIWGWALVGVLLRVAFWFRGDSYWADEAFLLTNLLEGSYRSVAFGAMDLWTRAPQAAPPLFAWGVKGATEVWGRNELGVRALPMLSACAVMVVYPLLARRVMSPAAAALTTALLALCPRLVDSAGNLKQYAGDALATTLILLVAVGVRAGMTPTARLGWASAAAAVLVWFSHPVVFVFAGVVLAFVVVQGIGWRGVLMTLPAWASAGAMYLLSARVQASPVFFEYWADSFVPWGRPWAVPGFVLAVAWGHFDRVGDGAGVLLLTALLPAAGWVWVRAGKGTPPWGVPDREQLMVWAACVSILGALFVAGALGQFPLRPARLSLFAIPACLVAGGVGLDLLARVWGGRGRLAWWVLVIPIGLGVWEAVEKVSGANSVADVRGALLHADKSKRPEEAVLLLETPMLALVELYRPEWLTQPGGVRRVEEGDTVEVTGGPGGTRFWIVLAVDRRRQREAHQKVAGSIRDLGLPVDEEVSRVGPSGEALRFTVPEGQRVVLRGVLHGRAGRRP